jgi:hypothetical protein
LAPKDALKICVVRQLNNPPSATRVAAFVAYARGSQTAELPSTVPGEPGQPRPRPCQGAAHVHGPTGPGGVRVAPDFRAARRSAMSAPRESAPGATQRPHGARSGVPGGRIWTSDLRHVRGARARPTGGGKPHQRGRPAVASEHEVAATPRHRQVRTICGPRVARLSARSACAEIDRLGEVIRARSINHSGCESVRPVPVMPSSADSRGARFLQVGLVLTRQVLCWRLQRLHRLAARR